MKINKSKLDILEAQYTKEMNRANGGFMNELISILQGIQTERQRAKNPIFGSEAK